MLRLGDYKFITYHGFEDQDMLFNLKKDPKEFTNVLNQHPELVAEFRSRAASITDPVQVEKQQARRYRNAKRFGVYEQRMGIDESERWQDNPPSARLKPAIQ